MTFRAVHNAISSIENEEAREAEVWERFRMSMNEFETRDSAANSELRAIQVRQVHRERTIVPTAVLAGAGSPGRDDYSGPSAIASWPNARERAAPPPPWRQPDTAPRSGLDFDVATAEWVDPFADYARWYNDT